MNARLLAALSTSLLVLAPMPAFSQTRVFAGGGPTGTSDFGFRGGWGATLGLEHRIAEAAAFVVRAEGAAVPSKPRTYSIIPLDLGETGPGASDATLLSLMAGLRLGGNGRFSPYVDALVGLGYLNDPANTAVSLPYGAAPGSSGQHTNVALSFGPGVVIRAPSIPALFADVHYDFYSATGASTPIIPVRVGMIVP